MKKLTALLLAAVLAALCALPALCEGAAHEIYDIEDLMAIADAPSDSYRLMTDLDMSGVDWAPIAFSGVFDGGGHTLYNLRVTQVGPDTRLTHDGNKKEYDTTFAGLFSVLENAEVRSLRLTGALVDIDTDTHCFAAGLTGYADRSVIEDCAVQGRVRMVSRGVMVGVAGIAGFGCGEFNRCEAKVELCFEDQNFESRCEEFLAGILACGIARINTCMVDIDGYDSCHGYVHNGGVVGMYYHCCTGFDCAEVNSNIITGRIRFFEDNPDRRAYCEAVIGESLSKPTQTKNNTDDFISDETKDFSVVLSPELCDQPDYTETFVPGTGSRWGYVRHECTGCGYRWTDRYTIGE